MNFVIIMTAVMGLVAAQSFYVTEDDYVDIDTVIADLPSLQTFTDCFLDRGDCPSQIQGYKACYRCNVPQKQRFGRYLQGLQARRPQDYQSFREKYDPMNIYFDALETELSQFANYETPVQRPTT